MPVIKEPGYQYKETKKRFLKDHLNFFVFDFPDLPYKFLCPALCLKMLSFMGYVNRPPSLSGFLLSLANANGSHVAGFLSGCFLPFAEVKSSPTRINAASEF